MALQIGQPAPEFILRSSDKQEVKLSDYKGKNVVLLFFPLAFTGVCTAELCDMRDNLAVYNNLNTEVLAVSVDSIYTLDRYKKDQGLTFPLLSDFNKEASEAYDSLYEKFGYGMKGVSKRSAFVIDTEGVIRYAEVLEDAGKVPDFVAVQNVLKNLN
jgi:peroxiredoxin